MGGRLVDGVWYAQGYEPDAKGRFVRQQSRFRDWVEGGSDARFTPEAGRYHLYVSYACPWAQRTLIMRSLKGLEAAIPVSVVHPYMMDGGWEFGEFPEATPDPIHHARFMRDIYIAADPSFTGRVTVPVLWDMREKTIVNNESKDILRMFDHRFNKIAQDTSDFAPPELLDQVEKAIDANYEPVNNGVYKCGFASSQEAYDEAADALFARLDQLETLLGKQRYLCGGSLTEADVCLYTTLVRFDAVYAVHFKCSEQRIVDYPNLWNYLKDLYQHPGFSDTTNMDHIRHHYFVSHPFINPTQIISRMPRIELYGAHDRHRFGA